MRIKQVLYIAFFFALSAQIIFGQSQFVEIGSKSGAFTRMGFGPRGMGMGNAMSAITTGNLVAYYNPALSPFQFDNSAQIGYSFLSLDRSLNFVSFTRRFKTKTVDGKVIEKGAGFSAGMINSGVGKIDGRDSQGLKTEELSTSENQFFLSVANRFSEKFSLGINFKFHYYSLYEDISASGLGFDIGALYVVNEQFKVSLVLTDLNTKYKWDTSDLWGQDGSNTTEKFPLMKKIGVGYNNKDLGLLASLEFENSNAGTNYLRGGLEYNIYPSLYLRGGIDKLNLSNTDAPARPSFGFSYIYDASSLLVGIDYAFVIEPYSSYDQHILGLSFNF